MSRIALIEDLKRIARATFHKSSCILLGMPARSFAYLLLLAGVVFGQDWPGSLIGNGWGLDHVIVAQRNADEAKQTFGAKLGFSIVSGNKFPDQGVENGPVLLPPAYLELVWVYDADKASAAVRSAVDTPLVAMLRLIQEQGNTVLSYNINVSPVEDAASFLRASGFKVTLPPSITTLRDGKQQPGPWSF